MPPMCTLCTRSRGNYSIYDGMTQALPDVDPLSYSLSRLRHVGGVVLVLVRFGYDIGWIFALQVTREDEVNQVPRSAC